MKVFVWERVDDVTLNWHPEAGVVVFAASRERAQELLTARHQEQSTTSPPVLRTPDYEREVDGVEERVFVFPDAGCC